MICTMSVCPNTAILDIQTDKYRVFLEPDMYLLQEPAELTALALQS